MRFYPPNPSGIPDRYKEEVKSGGTILKTMINMGYSATQAKRLINAGAVKIYPAPVPNLLEKIIWPMSVKLRKILWS